VTSAESDQPAQTRGRHAKSDDSDDQPEPEPEPDDEPEPEPEPEREPEPEKPAPPPTASGATRHEQEDGPPRRSRYPIGHHPGGTALLMSAGLITGVSLVPLLFDQLRFGVALEAARNARSMATPWPAGAAPWFWPEWVAVVALAVSVVVVLLGMVPLRVPDLVVLVLGGVLTLTTARAAWATFDVIRNGLWELIPVCILALLAFGSAVTAAGRWRSAPDPKGGEGPGGVAAVVLAAWLVVVLVLLAGAAIASSARTHAFGDSQSPPQGLPGLLSVRAGDAPVLDDLHGRWLAQLAAAQVTDDRAASEFAGAYADLATRLPVLLVRGDDTGAPELDDGTWLTMTRQSFGSQAEVQNWCAEIGRQPEACVPRMIS
jgi:hypothetical protein